MRGNSRRNRRATRSLAHEERKIEPRARLQHSARGTHPCRRDFAFGRIENDSNARHARRLQQARLHIDACVALRSPPLPLGAVHERGARNERIVHDLKAEAQGCSCQRVHAGCVASQFGSVGTPHGRGNQNGSCPQARAQSAREPTADNQPVEARVLFHGDSAFHHGNASRRNAPRCSCLDARCGHDRDYDAYPFRRYHSTARTSAPRTGPG